ncbi:MAG: STAS domain-containing protein [Turneriella sp.]|nr:STAS domain-containing protein [Turneriella sp.]
MDRELRYEIKPISPEIAIFDLSGDMNIYNANKLGEDFEKQVKQGVKNFIVNLKNLVMIDSAGIGVLFTMLSTVQSLDGQAILLSANQNIRKLFDVTQVSTYFVMMNSEADALAKIRGG